jgi:hypothetical protein
MQGVTHLSELEKKLIQAQVQPGEVVRWAGREPRSRILRKHGLRIGLFSLWTVGAGLLAARMILMNPTFLQKSFTSMLPVLAPICLAAVGAVLLGCEVILILKFEPELYAITTHRALVIPPGKNQAVWAYGPESLKMVKVRRRKDGSGDIIFERCVRWSTDAEGRSTRQSRVIGFFSLPCLKEVYEKLAQIGQPTLVDFERRRTIQ